MTKAAAIEGYIKGMVQAAVEEYLKQQEPAKSRKRYVIANWKMNKDRASIEAYLKDFTQGVQSEQVILCPAAPYLSTVSSLLQELNSSIKLGAQNVHHADQGSFTGEVSADMLIDFHCEYVLIGHSERRQQGECDSSIHHKLAQSKNKGLIPILCVGEQLADYEQARSLEVITQQLVHALHGLPPQPLIIAYEPVWAIGTGRTPTVAEIEHIHQGIRYALTELYDELTASQTSILYGGSVQADSAEKFKHSMEIDGLLVGGASLQADRFTEIVRAFL